MIRVPDNLKPLETEILTYMRELPRLLAEGHEGRHVLIKVTKFSVYGTRTKRRMRRGA